MSVSDRALQVDNRKKHEAACRELRKHLPSLPVIGEQLLIIHAAEVYLETHSTFEAFVRDELNIERRQAYRLMEAASVTKNLCVQIGHTAEVPRLESQLREIAKAPPEKQAEVVKKAVEKAAEENRKPTAKDYKKVVGELLLEDEKVSDPVPAPNAPAVPRPPEHHPKEMAGPIMAHVSTLTKLLNDLKKRAVDRGGEWIDLQNISTQISSLKYSLKSAVYYADCPDCGGTRCAKCKQTGFLPALKSSVVDGDK